MATRRLGGERSRSLQDISMGLSSLKCLIVLMATALIRRLGTSVLRRIQVLFPNEVPISLCPEPLISERHHCRGIQQFKLHCFAIPSICVVVLFMISVYSACPACHPPSSMLFFFWTERLFFSVLVSQSQEKRAKLGRLNRLVGLTFLVRTKQRSLSSIVKPMALSIARPPL